MTQPTTFGGRPLTPAPGVPTPELRVARFRSRAGHLFWSALVVIAVAGACGFFAGNLPDPFADWMLFAAAGVLVILLAVFPLLAWASRVYTITTRRVIERHGLLASHRRELGHVRGYTVALRRGPLQRLSGSGTLTLSNGVEDPLVLRNVPDAALIHEALVDQVEVNQILAHRDAQPLPPSPAAPPS